MTKRKMTNNDLQNTTQKTKYRATLNTGGKLRCSGRVGSSCSTSDTRRVTLVTNRVKCDLYLGQVVTNMKKIR